VVKLWIFTVFFAAAATLSDENMRTVINISSVSRLLFLPIKHLLFSQDRQIVCYTSIYTACVLTHHDMSGFVFFSCDRKQRCVHVRQSFVHLSSLHLGYIASNSVLVIPNKIVSDAAVSIFFPSILPHYY
jgi:hypothetical protein